MVTQHYDSVNPTRHPAETSPHLASNDHCEEGHLKPPQAFCPPLMQPFIWILLYISHKTVALFKYIATCLSNICFLIPAEEAQTALNNVLLSSRHLSDCSLWKPRATKRQSLSLGWVLIKAELWFLQSGSMWCQSVRLQHSLRPITAELKMQQTHSASPHLTRDCPFTVDSEKSL